MGVFKHIPQIIFLKITSSHFTLSLIEAPYANIAHATVQGQKILTNSRNAKK